MKLGIPSFLNEYNNRPFPYISVFNLTKTKLSHFLQKFKTISTSPNFLTTIQIKQVSAHLFSF